MCYGDTHYVQKYVDSSPYGHKFVIVEHGHYYGFVLVWRCNTFYSFGKAVG